jgi:hypothetical protein
MKKFQLFLLAPALITVGCQNPRTNVSIPTTGPRIQVSNAPAGAVLFLDSKAVGEARRFNGDPEVLQIEPGTHLVEIRSGDKLLFSGKIYFGSTELRTINL